MIILSSTDIDYSIELPLAWQQVSETAKYIFSNLQTYLVGDIPAIAKNPEGFILDELYERSKDTGVGVAYLGPKLLCDWGVLPTMNMVSGDRKHVMQVTDFDGEGARTPFHIVQELSGAETIVNFPPDQAKRERALLDPFLMGPRAAKNIFNYTQTVVQRVFKNWTEEKSVQHYGTYIASNVIGHCVFNIYDLSEEAVPLLRRVGKLVVSPTPNPSEVKEIAQELKKLTDEIVKDERAAMMTGFPMEKIAWEANEEITVPNILEKLRQLNIGADLMVEGNISFILAAGMILLNRHDDVKAELRNELKYFDWNGEDACKKLCELPYLNCVIDEISRFASLTGIQARQVRGEHTLIGKDKDGNEIEYKVRGNFIFQSHMFVNTHKQHMDERFWDKPHEFLPSRFYADKDDIAKQRAIEKMREQFMPFGTGRHKCPAGLNNRNGFAFVLAKVVLAKFVEYDLQIDQDYSPTPINPKSFYRTWKECHAALEPNISWKASDATQQLPTKTATTKRRESSIKKRSS